MTKDSDKTKKTKLNDKQQYIQSQLQDLANKEKNLMFQLDFFLCLRDLVVETVCIVAYR